MPASNNASDARLAPMVKGLPLFGNALSLGQDPIQFLLNAYNRYGSIFRISVFGKTVTVLAGRDANLFAQREGAKYFSNQEVFRALIQELGTQANMANLEGEQHSLFRRTAREGYSATTMRQQSPLALDFARQFIEK